MRQATFTFTPKLTAKQTRMMASHAGAARFARNQCLALVKEALQRKQTDPSTKVPWSRFDLINAFNQWKVSAQAGISDNGTPGLPWRTEVSQQVFEEGAVDLARGLQAFSASKKGKRSGRRVCFPRFRSKHRDKASFRLRNKRNGIRLEHGPEPVIVLPKFGQLRLRESTRPLRRLLKRGGKIHFATMVLEDQRWSIRLNTEVPDLHPSKRHAEKLGVDANGKYKDGKLPSFVGIDVGLKTFAVTARADGTAHKEIEAPKPLANALRTLKRANRCLARRTFKGKNWHRAKARVRRVHARVRRLRTLFLHETTAELVKSHGYLAVESVHVAGLVRHRKVARAFSDVGLGQFKAQLRYKCQWHNATLWEADRFFPSSKRCSRCAHRKEDLKLKDRTYKCHSCGLITDRDLNAAVNLAAEADRIYASRCRREARGDENALLQPSVTRTGCSGRPQDRHGGGSAGCGETPQLTTPVEGRIAPVQELEAFG